MRSYPEYEEYFFPYQVKQSRFSSHYYARRLVGTNQRVLEAGCCDGVFGAELTRAGNRVVGVDPQPLVPASAGYEAVLQGKLDQNLLGRLPLQRESFDRILLLDQIDRFAEPKQVLSQLRPLLAERGKLIFRYRMRPYHDSPDGAVWRLPL